MILRLQLAFWEFVLHLLLRYNMDRLAMIALRKAFNLSVRTGKQRREDIKKLEALLEGEE